MDTEVVGEVVLSERGSFRHVRRYLRGWHPNLGQLHMGLSGPETVVEDTVVRPTSQVYIKGDVVKTLYINRGLPGSGKSTRADRLRVQWRLEGLSVVICSSDDFFVCDCCRAYNFDLAKLRFAHIWCQEKCAKALEEGIDRVIIDNTNCSTRECKTYVLLGQQFGYDIVFLEPDTPWAFDIDELLRRNLHGVPREGLERMLSRWVPNMTVEKALGLQQSGPMSWDERAAEGKGAA